MKHNDLVKLCSLPDTAHCVRQDMQSSVIMKKIPFKIKINGCVTSLDQPTAPQVVEKENPRTNKQTNIEKEKLQTSATGSPTRHHQSSVSSKQTTAQTTLKITDLKDFNKLTSSNNAV